MTKCVSGLRALNLWLNLRRASELLMVNVETAKIIIVKDRCLSEVPPVTLLPSATSFNSLIPEKEKSHNMTKS